MPESLERRLFHELDRLPLIDPHTHISPHAPASETLADILGYHYYAELAHSAGMPRERIEPPGERLDPKSKVARLVEYLPAISNTVQYSWLIELAREFFDFSDPDLTSANWEALYESASVKMAQPDWTAEVFHKCNLVCGFLLEK